MVAQYIVSDNLTFRLNRDAIALVVVDTVTNNHKSRSREMSGMDYYPISSIICDANNRNNNYVSFISLHILYMPRYN